MAQHTIITQEPITKEPEIEIQSAPSVAVCRHHWVIQPADGPVSNGSCRVCGENREFKNYVESATWGDSRISGKSASVSSVVESTSDADYIDDQYIEEEPESAGGGIEVEV